MADTTMERNAEDDLQRDALVGLYRLMLLIRRLEESVYRKFHEAKIGGYLHRYDGMEALVVRRDSSAAAPRRLCSQHLP